MTNKNFFMGILVMVLVFGMMVVGCEIEPTDDYTEGDVFVTASGVMLHYYFSKTLEGIEKAIYDNGIQNLNPTLRNTTWTLNPDLDSNVKKAMDSKEAKYSCAFYSEAYRTYLIVNKKENNSWYTTAYN